MVFSMRDSSLVVSGEDERAANVTFVCQHALFATAALLRDGPDVRRVWAGHEHSEGRMLTFARLTSPVAILNLSAKSRRLLNP